MALVDLKRTEEDKAKERERWEKPSTENMEDYPYGLCLHLDEETIAKLGLTDAQIDTGKPVQLQATGMITSESINSYNGKTRRSMTIQLQTMALEQPRERENIQATLYGGNG